MFVSNLHWLVESKLLCRHFSNQLPHVHILHLEPELSNLRPLPNLTGLGTFQPFASCVSNSALATINAKDFFKKRHLGLHSHLNVEVFAPSSRIREVSEILPAASLADANSKTLISIAMSLHEDRAYSMLIICGGWVKCFSFDCGLFVKTNVRYSLPTSNHPPAVPSLQYCFRSLKLTRTRHKKAKYYCHHIFYQIKYFYPTRWSIYFIHS